MNDMGKRLSALFAAGTLAACALAGCGKAGAEEGISGRKPEEHEALTICSFNNLINQDFIAAFHEAYPEVNLEVQSYGAVNGSGYAMHSLAHGDIPDIYVTSQNFNEEAQKEYLLDLSNYDFVNHYSGSLLDSLEVEGSIYLLPSGYTLTGIYYNKTLMEENGWKVPDSFRELTELSEKIEAAGYQTMGHGMVLDGFPFNYFFNLGNTVYFGTPEGTQWKEEFPKGEARAVGSSGLKRAVEYFDKWVEEGFITGNHTDAGSFQQGKCIFFLCLGLSDYQAVTESGKIYEFGIMPWLSEDGSNNMLTRNVTRYLGINKKLAEKGNEQKLEDALKLLSFISTTEGQQALMAGTSEYMLPLNEGTLPEDSPYQEVADVISEGRTVPLLYVGWEEQIVPIAKNIKKLILREIDTDTLIESFDSTNDALLAGSSEDIFAAAAERLTLEETARLAAVAEGIAVDADCAMISLNEYHGNNLYNAQGLGWYLYEGNVDADMVNLIRPRSSKICVLEMTGAEIKAMQAAGFDVNKNGNPYKYLLFTKGDMALEDGRVYRLAVSAGELTEEMRKDAADTNVSPNDAITAYLRTLGTVKADVIVWE